MPDAYDGRCAWNVVEELEVDDGLFWFCRVGWGRKAEKKVERKKGRCCCCWLGIFVASVVSVYAREGCRNLGRCFWCVAWIEPDAGQKE